MELTSGGAVGALYARCSQGATVRLSHSLVLGSIQATQTATAGALIGQADANQIVFTETRYCVKGAFGHDPCGDLAQCGWDLDLVSGNTCYECQADIDGAYVQLDVNAWVTGVAQQYVTNDPYPYTNVVLHQAPAAGLDFSVFVD